MRNKALVTVAAAFAAVGAILFGAADPTVTSAATTPGAVSGRAPIPLVTLPGLGTTTPVATSPATSPSSPTTSDTPVTTAPSATSATTSASGTSRTTYRSYPSHSYTSTTYGSGRSSTTTATTVAPTTTSTVAPLPGNLPTPPSTLPLTTKKQSGHVDPVFADLSVVGFALAVLILAVQFVLTRRGRRGRPTL